MKRLALLAAASASLSLFGCDSASTTSPDAGVQASVNNSDNRKASYTPAAADTNRRHWKFAQILEATTGKTAGSLGAGARLAAVPRRVAVLMDPAFGQSNRLFMHTETDANADHVGKGNVWEFINNTYGGQVVTTRVNAGWYKETGWYGSRLRPTGYWYRPNQNTGITGMRYTAQAVPNYTGTGEKLPYPYDNNPVPGLNLYFSISSVTTLPRLPFDYIVLRLEDNCPENGYPFTQHFDEEDVNNRSGATFNLYPGWSGPGATGSNLAFCFVPRSDLPMTSEDLKWALHSPPFSTSSTGDVGLFAAPSNATLAGLGYDYTVNTLVIDGEDTDFAGQFIWEGLSSDYQWRVQQIMIISSAAETPFLSVFSIPRLRTTG